MGVGVSRSGLVALVGETPMTYLRQWRFEVARNCDQIHAEIAEQLGYESEASFSCAFKKATVQTPGSVRREKDYASFPIRLVLAFTWKESLGGA